MRKNHYFLSIEGAGVFFTVGHLHPSLMFAGKILILESHWVFYNLAQNFRLVTNGVAYYKTELIYSSQSFIKQVQ
jgi:hypothetical protein